MFYVFAVVVFAANLYVAITSGNWWSWFAVGFTMGATMVLALHDIGKRSKG